MDDKQLQERVLGQVRKTVELSASGAIKNDEGWQQVLSQQSPQERELLQVLASFSTLWQYFQNRKEELPPEIVEDLIGVEELPIEERIATFQDVNKRLMERIA